MSSAVEEAAAALADGRQITPFSERGVALTVAEAYRALPELRRLRGRPVVGRKIGFTNRGIWARYGVDRPMWGDVLDTTLLELSDLADSGLSLDGLCEPRLEPEIALGLRAAPRATMTLAELGRCVDWVAPAFEVVQSIYPNWRFDIPDCVLAGGLHGRLALGPKRAADAVDLDALPDLKVALFKEAALVERGVGRNALDGPLHALKHLVDLLADDPLNPPLQADDVVSTGTLTDAQPLAPGETWRGAYDALGDISLSFL